MKVEVIPYHGWGNNLRISNSLAELLVTLDVGPRILVYKTHHGANVFKVFKDQLGGTHENQWCIRGGHRFWLAPEDEVLSYHRDNKPVSYRQDPATGEVFIETVHAEAGPIRKILGITMDTVGTHVKVSHLAVNDGFESVTLASWGPSVMDAGGVAVIPQPPLGEHPRDLLPNRGAVLWPYTDLSDRRWSLGPKYWTLRQDPKGLPTKLGLIHREKWAAYVLKDSVFVKTIDYHDDCAYPDGGCNFETFTNPDMLELEALGPLVTLEPGGMTGHTEHWHLFHLPKELDTGSQESLAEWFEPHLEKIIR